MPEILISTARFKSALDKLMSSGFLNALYPRVAKKLAADVKKNIVDQGQTFGKPWKEASKWLVAKKGTSKVLRGMEKNVAVRNKPGSSEVVFNSPGRWKISSHHEGFTVPATGRIVRLALRKPSALGVKRSEIYFKSVRDSRVPARRIWPTQTGARQSVNPMIKQWAAEVEAQL